MNTSSKTLTNNRKYYINHQKRIIPGWLKCQHIYLLVKFLAFQKMSL